MVPRGIRFGCVANDGHFITFEASCPKKLANDHLIFLQRSGGYAPGLYGFPRNVVQNRHGQFWVVTWNCSARLLG